MSKYYKKTPKESFQFDSKSVSWPNHKTSLNGWPKHTSKRRVKKFNKYEVRNDWLFEFLFGEVENFKRLPIQTHWKNLEDARNETSESWIYTIDDEETFQNETSEWNGITYENLRVKKREQSELPPYSAKVEKAPEVSDLDLPF